MNSTDTLEQAMQIFRDHDPKISYNRVWFNIMRAHRKFHPLMAKALRAKGLKDPIWYEILLAVENKGQRGKLMQELETNLFVPQYALSRHISRMEEEGLIRREFISDGKRKQLLFLTDKGIGLHQKIWPAYMDAMQEAIGPMMSEDEAYQLSYFLVKLLPSETQEPE